MAGHPRKYGLKTIGVKSLRRQPAILRGELRQQRIVQPVVGVDDVNIVTGLHNPSESRLPSGDAAHRVVLNVIDPGQKRRELQLGDDAEQARGERGLRQRDLIQFRGGVDEDARQDSERDVGDELVARASIKIARLVPPFERDLATVGRPPVDLVTEEVVAGANR